MALNSKIPARPRPKRRLRTSPAAGSGPSRKELEQKLLARLHNITPEDRAEFDELRKVFVGDLHPRSDSEAALVERAARAQWLLKRLAVLERDLLNERILSQKPEVDAKYGNTADRFRIAAAFQAETQALDWILRQETIQGRELQTTMTTLRQLQSLPLSAITPRTEIEETVSPWVM